LFDLLNKKGCIARVNEEREKRKISILSTFDDDGDDDNDNNKEINFKRLRKNNNNNRNSIRSSNRSCNNNSNNSNSNILKKDITNTIAASSLEFISADVTLKNSINALNKVIGSKSKMSSISLNDRDNFVHDVICQEAQTVLVNRILNEDKQLHLSLDAKWIGNVSRFINHSCSPNLEKATVFVDSHDKRIARVALFSSQSIPAFTELSYDYDYDSVEGKFLKCNCGSINCKDYLY
jgi:hypothetical protein